MSKKELTAAELQQVGHLKLQKAHVPLKACIKIALKNMWHKKIRFLVMFLICGISLSFLSITIELNGEKLRENVYTMIENGYRYTEIYKHVPVDKNVIKNDIYKKYNYTDLDLDSYDKIKSSIKNITVHQYNKVEINYAGLGEENKNFFYTGQINTIIKYDPTNTYELLAGQLPTENTKEILVTDYLISAFSYFNLYPNCTNYLDYLNQRLDLANEKNYIIVGIMKTNYDRWSKFSNIPNIEISDKENYAYTNDLLIMNSVVLTSYYFNLEQFRNDNVLKFSNSYFSSNYIGTWGVTTNETNVDYQPRENLAVVYNDVTISWYYNRFSETRFNSFGRKAENDDEIVIPYTWIKPLFGYNWNKKSDDFWDYNSINTYQNWWNTINNKKITLTLNKKQGNTYTKTYKIVGITEDQYYTSGGYASVVQIGANEYQNIYYNFNKANEKIIVQLPKKSLDAYQLFERAYKEGYIINVFAYKDDIESYNVDPFIDLMSKVGLFVFAGFTMGIMWTIISIEIVDSKKEIGILRSIGLSGGKVSFIFVFQMSLVVLLSYIMGNYIAYRIIPIYNSGIKDEFNKITLYMYSYTYRSPLYLAIFAIGMTIISTFVPLYKIMKHKIIDVISEREN